MSYELPDSGRRENFSTGSRRDSQEGKGRYDLLPWCAIERVAVHMENGARKYGDRNWELGQPLGRYLNSAIRHLGKWARGECGEDHLAAAAWNILAVMHHQHHINTGNLPQELRGKYGIQTIWGGDNQPQPKEPDVPPENHQEGEEASSYISS